MRRRITKAFIAAAAAGATVTTLGLAASPAGAATLSKYFSPSGGTPIATDANCTVTPEPGDNCGMAGYQATGHDFRFASATIQVPDHVGNTEEDTSPADPSLYVGLDDSTNATYRYARVGIAPCSDGDDFIVPGVSLSDISVDCPPSGWLVFTAVDEPFDNGPTVDAAPLAEAFMGDGIAVSAYLTPNGTTVQTVATLPDGTKIQHLTYVGEPAYSTAVALADWTTSVESGALLPEPAVPTAKVRDSQFFQGRFTTVTGRQGTFTGPWTTTALEATSNGSLPPSGALIGQPSYLWNDGHGFNGQGSDAFGVWRFPF